MIDIKFLGHSAVLIESEGKVLAIDPWLEGNPMCPEEFKNPKQIDILILTHGHSDHAADALALCKGHGCKLVATFELAMLLGAEGVPEKNLIPMNKGGSVVVDGIKISLTHAMHSNSYDTSEGTRYAGEACGVVVQIAGKSIYHAGDTALFSDMTLIKDTYAPELGLLPIGDRFTMGPAEAASAARMLGLKTAIPVHYETFPLLTGTAESFQKELENDSLLVVPLRPGETHRLE